MGTKYYPVIDVIATGKNILRLRKAQGYSVADLQEFLGFEAPQAIYKWQSGKSLPSTDNLFALSVFFEVSIEDIAHLVPSLKSGSYLLSRAAFATDFFYSVAKAAAHFA